MNFSGIQEKKQPVRTHGKLGMLVPSSNPIHDNATVSYAVKQACRVAAAVYDGAGKRIRDLGASFQTAGSHQIAWNSSGVDSGVYIFKLSTADETSELRLVKTN